MTKATKRTIGVICLLWLGTLLLLFANYKTKVYLEQLRSQVDAVTQQEQANATAVKRQPSRTMEDVLVRTDAQLVTTSFSNENYAAKAKSLVSLCDKELKEKTGGVSNESVQAEMQRRPGMNGRLVIPSVGVNVALFDGHAQRFVDAKDSIFWQGIRCWLVTTGTKDSQKSKTATPERWLTFTEVLLCRH